MGLLADLKLGLRHPQLIVRKLNQLYHTRLYTWDYNQNGIDIFAQDWDNLIVIDACRLDMIGDSLFGESVEKVQSRGSGTIEFLRGNFGNRNLTDTVYVTANPQLYRNRDSISPNLHHVIDVWMEDGWDDEYGTVLPETVFNRAIEASEKFPKKRLIVHFMQPHYPFIGSNSEFGRAHLNNPNSEELPLWMKIQTGQIESDDISRVVRAYKDNLEPVLPYTEHLIDELDGKTVVTSDHGNLLGDPISPIPITDWGHPLSLYVDELISVPWITFDDDTRKEIIAEQPEENIRDASDGVVSDRLEQLGYK